MSTMTLSESLIAAEFMHQLVGGSSRVAILPDAGDSLQALAHFLDGPRRRGLGVLDRAAQDLAGFGFHRAAMAGGLDPQLLLHGFRKVADRQRGANAGRISIASNAVNSPAKSFPGAYHRLISPDHFVESHPFFIGRIGGEGSEDAGNQMVLRFIPDLPAFQDAFELP